LAEAVESIASGHPTPEANGRDTLFTGLSSADLLSAGVPEDWIGALRRVVTEDEFLEVAGHLPPEAAETLLHFAVTREWRIPQLGSPADPFAHADTLRNFWKVENCEELQRALAYPADQWAIYLHPSQRRLVEMNFSGPARISGSAGTGKTIVALHRAVRLAISHPTSRILFTTNSEALANLLAHKLAILAGKNSPVTSRITVVSFDAVADELYQMAFGERPRIAEDAQICDALQKAMRGRPATGLDPRFLFAEWREFVDARQMMHLHDYIAAKRTGRGTGLGRKQREKVWQIFEAARETLDAEGVITRAQAYRRATGFYRELRQKPFDYILVDEAQDLSVAELAFFAAIAPSAPDALFFTGDLGQRIHRWPFSWKELGVDIGGRSHTLKVNYRTSHQIRRTADALLPPQLHGPDGTAEWRKDTVSVFSGPKPILREFATTDEECRAVADWIGERLASGVAAAEIAVLVRCEDDLVRAHAAVTGAGREPVAITEAIAAILNGNASGSVAAGLLEQARGFEFKAVIVMACDAKTLPLEARLIAAADDDERVDVNLAERRLLYVGCTRAREHLLVSGVEPTSPFLKLFEI
jgi:superfamily I DNA/RNA helicase